jgi:F0F1-type ATP synthase membrane subunit b/b'
MLLSLDGTFLVQMANFVVFWILLNVLFIGPTRRVIQARQEKIAALNRETHALTEAAAAEDRRAQSVLDDASRRSREIIRLGQEESAGQALEIERRSLEEAAATVQVAHATVAAERRAALEKQQPFIAELARAMLVRATDFGSAS